MWLPMSKTWPTKAGLFYCEPIRVTPLQPDNSGAQEQLQQWLKDADVAELSAQEQDAIGQLLAELQELPPAAISPQLESRLQGLSQLQPTPSNPLKRLLALLAAGVAAAGAVLGLAVQRLGATGCPKRANTSRCPSQSTQHPRTCTGGGGAYQQRIPAHQQPTAWRPSHGDNPARESDQSAGGQRPAAIAFWTDLPALGRDTLGAPGLHDIPARYGRQCTDSSAK